MKLEEHGLTSEQILALYKDGKFSKSVVTANQMQKRYDELSPQLNRAEAVKIISDEFNCSEQWVYTCLKR